MAALLVAVLGVVGLVMGGQPQPEVGAAVRRLVAGGDPVLANNATSGHGWAFLPAPEGSDGYLVHLVPRQGVPRASAGSVRLVSALKKAPLAIAGWKGEAFMIMAPPGDTATGPGDRTLSSIRAVGPMSLGNWDYKPAERLELKAGLPNDAVPCSIVGTALGPLLVWERTSPPHNGELEIVLLDDSSQWRTLRPPPGFPLSAELGEAHALATTAGVLVAVRNVGERDLRLWRATPDLSPPPAPPAAASPEASASDVKPPAKGSKARPAPKPPADAGPVRTRWTSEGTLRLPSELATAPLRTMGPSAPHWLVRDSGQTLLAAHTHEGMTVWRLDSTLREPVVLWHAGALAPDAGVLSMGGLGTVTVLAFGPSAGVEGGTGASAARSGGAASIPDAGRLRVVEVSHSTGSVLADVAAHTDGFLSRRELWVLWLLFIGVGVVVLLVVVNTDGPQEVQLPDGTALATPLRRTIAAVLDIAVASGVTGMLVGGTPAQWLSPATSASSSLVPLVSVIGFAFVLSVVGEAAIGASPGKLLVGLRVMGLAPLLVSGEEGVGEVGGAGAKKKVPGTPTVWQAGPPRWHQALVRNAIRWFMPPMGLAMIVDNNWRHPGDLLGRTVVVERFRQESDEQPAEDDEP